MELQQLKKTKFIVVETLDGKEIQLYFGTQTHIKLD